MRYQEFFNFASGGITDYALNSYRINGPYDPNVAIGGGSCTGWDELAAIYGKYRCLGAKLTATCYNTCATPLVICVRARDSTDSAFSSGTQVVNGSYEYGANIRAIRLVPYTGAGMAHPRGTVSLYASVRRLEGLRSNIDEDYTAATNGTPVTQCAFDVCMAAWNGTTVSLTSNVMVNVVYYVRFYDRNLAPDA